MRSSPPDKLSGKNRAECSGGEWAGLDTVQGCSSAVSGTSVPHCEGGLAARPDSGSVAA